MKIVSFSQLSDFKRPIAKLSMGSIGQLIWPIWDTTVSKLVEDIGDITEEILIIKLENGRVD